MSVKIGLFRKNVGKLISTKQFKETLRYTSRKTDRAKIAKLAVDLNVNVGQLLESQEGYILGAQMTGEFKELAKYNLGEIGAAIVSLAKALKIKTPTSTKKKKLIGTRAAGLLKLHGLSSDLMSQASTLLFSPLPKSTVKKVVTIPSTGASEEREVQVVDVGGAVVVQEATLKSISSMLEDMIQLYWAICYDITGSTPSDVFEAKLTRMKEENPSIEFGVVNKKPEVLTAA